MVITGLSVAVALIIGMVELLQVRSMTILFLTFYSVTGILPYTPSIATAPKWPLSVSIEKGLVELPRARRVGSNSACTSK
jgi:hypothetical protein